jgi:hypothetical protein
VETLVYLCNGAYTEKQVLHIERVLLAVSYLTFFIFCILFSQQPAVETLVYLCNGAYTEKQVLRMERVLLDKLGFAMCRPTCADAVDFLLSRSDIAALIETVPVLAVPVPLTTTDATVDVAGQRTAAMTAAAATVENTDTGNGNDDDNWLLNTAATAADTDAAESADDGARSALINGNGGLRRANECDDLVSYLVHVSLLEYRLVTHPPSLVAAAIVANALYQFGLPIQPVLDHSGYSAAQLHVVAHHT